MYTADAYIGVQQCTARRKPPPRRGNLNGNKTRVGVSNIQSFGRDVIRVKTANYKTSLCGNALTGRR